MRSTDYRPNRAVFSALICVLLGAGLASCSGSGRSLYSVAAEGESREKAEELIVAGADVNEVNAGNGWTPLHAAAANGHPKMCQLLISHGAQVNAQDENGMTPLHLAMAGGHDEASSALLVAGADMNIRNKQGRTPKEMAQSAP